MRTDRSPWPSLRHLATTALTITGHCLGRAAGQDAEGRPHDVFDPLRKADAMRHLAQYEPGYKDICVVNLHQPAGVSDGGFAAFAGDNHRRYAERHQYKYFRFEGRVTADMFADPTRGPREDRFGGGLNWQKLGALAAVADRFSDDGFPMCRWMLWIDTDAVFSNPAIRLESIIGRLSRLAGVSTNVIFCQEDAGYDSDFVNTGVFLLKNSWGGRDFLRGTASKYPIYKDRWLQEQDGIHDYIYNRDSHDMKPHQLAHFAPHLRPGIVVVPQRTFNSFYWPEPPHHAKQSALWQPCDFVGHLAGATAEQRLAGMQAMQQASRHC